MQATFVVEEACKRSHIITPKTQSIGSQLPQILLCFLSPEPQGVPPQQPSEAWPPARSAGCLERSRGGEAEAVEWLFFEWVCDGAAPAAAGNSGGVEAPVLVLIMLGH